MNHAAADFAACKRHEAEQTRRITGMGAHLTARAALAIPFAVNLDLPPGAQDLIREEMAAQARAAGHFPKLPETKTAQAADQRKTIGARAARLLAEGMTQQQAADHLGVGRQVLRDAVRDFFEGVAA